MEYNKSALKFGIILLFTLTEQKIENHGKQKRKQWREKKKKDRSPPGIGSFRQTRSSDECKLRTSAHLPRLMESSLKKTPSAKDSENKDSYVCSACGTTLFDAATKFDAGCGFPSFWQHHGNNVKHNFLQTYGRSRIQLLCNHCGQHLGHLFNSKVTPTGVRYCINGHAIVCGAAQD